VGTTVVIGFAEALSAPEVAWSLVEQGFTVFAFSRRGRQAPLRKSRFVTVFEITPPELDATQAVMELERAVSDLGRAAGGPVALMPLDDEAVWLCERVNAGSGIVFVGPKGEAAEIALDKRRQVKLAQTCGFNIPWTRFVEREAGVFEGEMEFPLIFKSALAVAENEAKISKGWAWICSDRQELETAISSWKGRGPMLLQQFVPGVGEGLFGLATANGVSAWSGHRRLRMMNPHGSGASACTGLGNLDPACLAASETFLARCGWRGLFMIEMLRDPSGKLWFMELNGRAWGSMALARRAGLEYPAWAVRLALHPETSIEVPARSEQNIVCRHLGRELVHLLFVLRGSKSKALVNWPPFWKTCFQVLRFRKEEHWYNWRPDDRGVFVSDTLSTLRRQIFKSKCHP
jgi:predicted ATP-grasp superfamily ATP-dependent carboligase